MLDGGTFARVVGGTAMNDQSSRSHAILTITLEQLIERFFLIIYFFFIITLFNWSTSNLIKGKFHLVDLAGSEQIRKTKAKG